MTNKFCPQCGERLKPGASFCSVCGAGISTRAVGDSPRRPAKARRSFTWLPIIVIVGGALILVGLLLNRAGPPTVADVPDEHDTAGLPYPDVPRIPVAEARERLDNGTAVIVDVRSPQQYAEAHVPDALSIPLDEIQSRYRELPADAEIITYCT